jgi:hypothetical protein
MNKAIATISAVLLTAGTLVTGGAASAATTQEATGVSAYYRVDLGYMVGWTVPTNRTGVVGYTVTANTGQTCSVKAAMTNVCTFKTAALGYAGSFNFTVSTLGVSSVLATSRVSNTIGTASIPSAPLLVTSEAISDTQINVAWVPATGTGNLDLYGYKVTYWESGLTGSPVNSTKTEFVSTDTHAQLIVSPETMYIINVASCNALGCNSANYWSYVATNPESESVQAIVLPTIIGGGSADTTCFESIYDANAGETALGSCGSVVANPATYPVINPSATEVLDPELATKFANKAVLSNFTKTYSLKTWGAIGIDWFARFTATSKSYTLGFTTTPRIASTTPSTCEVVGPKIVLKAVGLCSLVASVDGNGVFKPSNTATASFSVTN